MTQTIFATPPRTAQTDPQLVPLLSEAPATTPVILDVTRLRYYLEITNPSKPDWVASLPFSVADTTAGSENEMQAAVQGPRESVDLPAGLIASNYYRNINRRAASGDVSRKLVETLDLFLAGAPDNVWENSWVRFPHARLNHFAMETMRQDLLADKQHPDRGNRADLQSFLFRQNGEAWVRVPISYLARLALADIMGHPTANHGFMRNHGARLMNAYLSDNTSPEIISYYPVKSTRGHVGGSLARETARRLLLTQCLMAYANNQFSLEANQQRAIMYNAPHPPCRQQALNAIIPDSFYRHLFMNPCLAGWNRGEQKHEYMKLCHQVLSRSRLNTLAKLKEAGIITHNLVVLPTTSNTSLANNGTHVSLGSRKLTQAFRNGNNGCTADDEKAVGDLAIKIIEHFLPLFVGTYSAAPYRLDFADFHPEKVLGFLPHELDYTHLRMLWRRWRKKASNRFFGHPISPFGPEALDHSLSRIMRLKGDYIPDFRLIDYLVSPMSTTQSPALNGRLNSDRYLARDLCDMGIFDERMPLYLLYRQRTVERQGFAGFEGRFYSLCPSLLGDFAPAVALQQLVTLLAYKYILSGTVTHAQIPDTPFVESERRQIIFGAALGIPTFYVHGNSGNDFLRGMLHETARTRVSNRYPDYGRIYIDEYRLTLLQRIRRDGADLLEMLGMHGIIDDLEARISRPTEHGAWHTLTRDIMATRRGAPSPLSLSAGDFMSEAERYYRDDLRLKYIREALAIVRTDCETIEQQDDIFTEYPELGRMWRELTGGKPASQLIDGLCAAILAESARPDDLRRLVLLIALITHIDQQGHIIL